MMMKLTKNPEIPKEMIFAEFLGICPRLYDGVDLDKATIDYLNNTFYEYKLNPESFERRYLNNLRKATGIYNNLKSIELTDQIFDITTNTSFRDTTLKTINRLKSDRTLDRDGDTITDGTNNTKTSDSSRFTPNTISKAASRVVPMNSKGSFDELFEWEEHGATQVQETRNSGGTDSTQNDGTTTAADHTKTTIDQTDVEKLKSLNDIANTGREETSAINGQVVTLVKNIWDYLITPKAIDYLTDALEPSFILII